MRSLIPRMRLWLAALLFAPTLLLAAPYQSIGSIGINQPVGPAVTDAGGGMNRWVSGLDWTNNNAFATGTLYLVVAAQWVGGAPVDANKMLWDNAAGVFRQGNLLAEADNEDFFIDLMDTDIDATAYATFGIAAGDSLAAFRIGALAPGQTASNEVNFLVSNATGEMWFSGFIVQDLQRLPLPGSLPLVAIAALALWTAGGRRRAAR